MCKKIQLDQATRWSSVRVFVRPCSGNRLQITSHENWYRGPTGDLFDLIFFTQYSWVNWLCFGYFQIFPERSPFDLKITLTLTPFPYVRRLLDLRVCRIKTWSLGNTLQYFIPSYYPLLMADRCVHFSVFSQSYKH